MKKLLCVIFMAYGFSAVAAPTNDGMYATMQTTMGDVCFQLYYTNTPRTVANFVGLAEGTRPWIDPRTTFVSTEPYYNGIIFHRVIDWFMVQGGSPKGDGTDGPGYSFDDEFVPSLRHNHPGTVSMANSGADSNGGQFFITVTNTPWLDDVHTVFGNVVSGMQVVSNIAAVVTDANDRPLVDVTITNVFITRNGTNAQNFAVTNWLLPEVSAVPMSVTASNGIHLALGTATSSYQYVYSSVNLSNWSGAATNYWPVPAGDWNLGAAGETKEFFHANRVVYPTDKNRTGSPASHRIVVTIGSYILTIAPDGINSGVFNYQGYPDDQIVSWEWDSGPNQVVFFVETDWPEYYTFLLRYSTPTNGQCNVYYYSYGWQNWGTGTFTDVNLNP